MRHIEVPRVEDPDRFFPDPRLIGTPRYRVHDDDSAEFFHPITERWRPLHPFFVGVMQGLETGLPFDEWTRQLQLYPELHINKKAARKLARKYCWGLAEVGLVAFDLPDPPAVFQDRYERIKELGRGGLGIAHLCLDRQTGAQVVVKHPWGVKAPIESGQRALAMEIAVMQDVTHPLVPRLHDHFAADGGLLHVVRDFVDGERLTAKSVRRRMEDPAERARLLGQVCEGLHAIHEAGYLFFDPSPDNFYLVGDQVITGDPGGCLPRNDDGIVPVKGARGSPGYVAREMRDKDHPWAAKASVASDVWSIGCLLYYFVYGRRPKRAWFHDEIVASLDEADHDIRPEDRHAIDLATRDAVEERPKDLLALRDLIQG